MKIIIFLSTIFFLSGCANKRGISLQYYNDCKEYYDVQGYYHKKCDDTNTLPYKSISDFFSEDDKKQKDNVW